LQAGVKIYERREALLHAKTIFIDDVWSTIGSTNMDPLSFLHNDEVNAVVLGFAFAGQMRAMFERDYGAIATGNAGAVAAPTREQSPQRMDGAAVEYWL
jgi:cardiolipin synthase